MRSVFPYVMFIPSLTNEVVLSLQNRFNQFLISLAIKWRLARDKHIKNDTNAPDVAFFAIFSLNNFRRHKKCGAYDAIHLLFFIYASWSTKVNKFHDIVFNSTKVNVVRLNVTMNNSRVMQVGSRGYDLLNYFCSFSLRKIFLKL